MRKRGKHHKRCKIQITYLQVFIVVVAFITCIVFYCEIHQKYCKDTINRQFNSTMENSFAGKIKAVYVKKTSCFREKKEI
jgi:hypothetical protein